MNQGSNDEGQCKGNGNSLKPFMAYAIVRRGQVSLHDFAHAICGIIFKYHSSFL